MRRITVNVKPRARQNSAVLQEDDSLLVHVTALPRDGDANQAVVKTVAHYLHIAPSMISIVSGKRSRTKILEIT